MWLCAWVWSGREGVQRAHRMFARSRHDGRSGGSKWTDSRRVHARLPCYRCATASSRHCTARHAVQQALQAAPLNHRCLQPRLATPRSCAVTRATSTAVLREAQPLPLQLLSRLLLRRHGHDAARRRALRPGGHDKLGALALPLRVAGPVGQG